MRLSSFFSVLGLAAASLPWALQASPVQFELRPDRPVVAEGTAQDLVLRLNLRADPVASKRRTPLNLCLVLDKSGSMQGGKLQRLQEAALQAIARLGKDDILSIIAFSDGAQVLLPATKLRDHRAADAAIESLHADGSTAFYAGVSEGLAEVKKFKGAGRVSRILVISDGLANVGPASPSALAGLGREAGRLGVPVTTFGLGLGYGEDLMTQLAMASDGNHAFIPDEGGLQAFFDKELGEALGVAARSLVVEVTLGPGVTLKGSLDRDVEQDGRTVRWHLSQLPGGVDKRLLLEVQAPAMKAGQDLKVASAKLRYEDADGAAQSAVEANASVRADSVTEAEAKVDKEVLAQGLEAKANQSRAKAIALRDKGDAAGAAQVLNDTSKDLNEAASAYKIQSLGSAASGYSSAAAEMAAPAADWNVMRKSMKAEDHKERTQQAY